MLTWKPASLELLLPLEISVSNPRSPVLFSNMEFEKEHTHPDYFKISGYFNSASLIFSLQSKKQAHSEDSTAEQ